MPNFNNGEERFELDTGSEHVEEVHHVVLQGRSFSPRNDNISLQTLSSF